MSRSSRKSKSKVDPVESAVQAGLRYVEVTSPGFTRIRSGKGYCYRDHEGRLIRSSDHLKRIRSLVIPPAWTRVWICPSSDGHLQAIGYDARGRRQYRYHPRYREIRNETKYARMTAFGAALPSIRSKVTEDLELPGLQREKVIASVVRLLETTLIRIGNPEYARDNESFGLTTLRNQHVDIEGWTVQFHFRGKSGVDHEIAVKDRRISRVIKACHDLPGYDLFEYVDAEGQVRSVTSGDVNEYIKQVTGKDFTAKDFRTWAGTVHTAFALAAMGPFESATEAKRNITQAIKQTAKRLGNRPATCRAYYVHPAVTEAYLNGTLLQVLQPTDEDRAMTDLTTNPNSLNPEEVAVLRLIRKYEAPAAEPTETPEKSLESHA